MVLLTPRLLMGVCFRQSSGIIDRFHREPVY